MSNKSVEYDHNALNENLEYCNELAERINILGDAVLSLAKRIDALEGKLVHEIR